MAKRLLNINFGRAGKGLDSICCTGHVDNMCCFIRPGVVALAWCDNPDDPQVCPRCSHCFMRHCKACTAVRCDRCPHVPLSGSYLKHACRPKVCRDCDQHACLPEPDAAAQVSLQRIVALRNGLIVWQSQLLKLLLSSPFGPVLQHEVGVRNLEILNSTTDAKGRKLEVVKVHVPPPLFRTYKEAGGVHVRSVPSLSAWPSVGIPYGLGQPYAHTRILRGVCRFPARTGIRGCCCMFQSYHLFYNATQY